MNYMLLRHKKSLKGIFGMKRDCLQIQLIHCWTSIFLTASLFRKIQIFLKLIHWYNPIFISEVRSRYALQCNLNSFTCLFNLSALKCCSVEILALDIFLQDCYVCLHNNFIPLHPQQNKENSQMESSIGMSAFSAELEWKPKHWAAIFLFNRREMCNVLAVLLVLFPLLM